MRRHPMSEWDVKKIIGFYPAGEHQIIIQKDGVSYSVVRGMVSFGYYEIQGGIGRFKDPERFGTAKELIEALKAND